MSMVTTKGPADIVEQPARPQAIGMQLKDKEGQFKAALPAHIPVERFMRVVMTAIQNNPKLAHADRASLWTSSIKAAQDGLLPDGREGALVIYRTKSGADWIEAVQWMPMIAGIRKKVRNSGEIATWDAHVVHQEDDFEYELGDDPFIKHKPTLKAEPGPVIAAYSVATLKTGEKSREVMTLSQINKVRNASRSKDKGPWVDWFEEMCRKTVARRHAKVLPMSTDLDDLIRRDDALYDLQGARDEAKLLAGGRPHSLAGKLDMLAAGLTPAEAAAPAETDPPAVVIADEVEQTETTGAEKAAKQAEDERREAIGDETPAQEEAKTSPSAEVYAEMHGLISDGHSYLAARNKLDPELLGLLSKDQIASLKKHEADTKAKGAAS